MGTPCVKAEEIAVLKKQTEDIERVLFKGQNGDASLQKTVILLEATTKNLSKSVDNLTTVVNGLAKAYSENIGAKEIIQEVKTDKKWKITTVSSIALVIGKILYDIFVYTPKE